MRTLSKKQIAVVSGVAAAALATSGVAYAYWTTGGSGTGTATTSAGSSNQLEVSAYTSPSNIAPGVAAGPITVTIHNKSGSEKYYVGAVDVSINSVEKALGAPAGTCDATDYAFVGSTHLVDGAADLAPGASTTFHGVDLVFNDKATNQDACKGAKVNLDFVTAES